MADHMVLSAWNTYHLNLPRKSLLTVIYGLNLEVKTQKQASIPRVVTHVVFLVLVVLQEGDDTVVDKESQGQHARQLWEPGSYL